MKIGIVGANSSVGTELSVLLRDSGYTVVPIVRSTLAAAPLEYQGFDCRIADITNESEAKGVLSDIETVVISAYAPPLPPNGRPRQSRITNENIVNHSVRHSSPNSTIIYLSSIMAFGDDIYPDYENTIYPREKRHLEKETLKTTKKTDKSGYIFRLGHVNGPTQNLTRGMINNINESGSLVVQADPERASNIVHTVSIADSIERCHQDGVDTGRYTIVNKPQWSWREVFEYYSDGTSITFVDNLSPSESSTFRTIQDTIWSSIESHRSIFIPYMVHLPEQLNDRIIQRHKKGEVSDNIDALKNGLVFTMHHFEHLPAPGRHVPNTRKTTDLLPREEVLRDSFCLQT